MSVIRISLIFFALSLSMMASDFYYAQTSAGANNGTSCVNAYAYNDGTNGISTAGKDVGDNILHLCGTFSGSNGQQWIALSGGGTLGHVLTIKFETGASLTAPYHSSSGGIALGSNSFILVDGGSNGTIQNTLNGTSGGTCPGGTCTQQQVSRGVVFSGSSVEIKNLTIADIYDHTSTSDTGLDQTQMNCIAFHGSNILIHDNVMHDAGWCIDQTYGTSDTSVAIYNNSISRSDHGWAVSTSHTGGTAGGFSFYSNHVYAYSNWDTGTNVYHHDGIHCFTSGTTGVPAHISSMDIYNNLFEGPMGNNATGHIFIEGGSGGSTTPCADNTSLLTVYNNVAISDSALNNGLFGIFSGEPSLYNNTLIGSSTASGVCYASNSIVGPETFKNNVVTTCNQLMAITGSITFTPDYNIYANGGSNAFVCNTNFYNTSQYASWQACIAGDSHSTYNASASLNANGSPQSGSPVIGAGTNLTSLSIAALDSDTSAGNSRTPIARPAVAAWDMGAYQFVNPINGNFSGVSLSGVSVN